MLSKFLAERSWSETAAFSNAIPDEVGDSWPANFTALK